MSSFVTDILRPLDILIGNWLRKKTAQQKTRNARNHLTAVERQIADTRKQLADLQESEAYLHDQIGTLEQEESSFEAHSERVLQSIAPHQVADAAQGIDPKVPVWFKHTGDDMPATLLPDTLITAERTDGKYLTYPAKAMTWKSGFSNSIARWRLFHGDAVCALAGNEELVASANA